MDLNALVHKQIEADRRRGFSVEYADRAAQIRLLESDLVGLLGEIGEFANVLKKVNLKLTRPTYSGPSFEEAADMLHEELADAMIYLMRLSHVSGADLQEEVTKKMKFNDDRYRSLEK